MTQVTQFQIQIKAIQVMSWCTTSPEIWRSACGRVRTAKAGLCIY